MEFEEPTSWHIMLKSTRETTYLSGTILSQMVSRMLIDHRQEVGTKTIRSREIVTVYLGYVQNAIRAHLITSTLGTSEASAQQQISTTTTATTTTTTRTTATSSYINQYPSPSAQSAATSPGLPGTNRPPRRWLSTAAECLVWSAVGAAGMLGAYWLVSKATPTFRTSNTPKRLLAR